MAYPDIFSGVLQPIYQAPSRKVIQIDGKVTVDFDIMSELNLSDEYERPITIDVAVEEALTGRRQNVSKQITLHKYKYTMELIKTSEYYKPGLKYTTFVRDKTVILFMKKKKLYFICVKQLFFFFLFYH